MEPAQEPINALEAARIAGFDLNLVDLNLALSPEDRLRRHDLALELALMLRAAGRQLHAPSPSTAATPR